MLQGGLHGFLKALCWSPNEGKACYMRFWGNLAQHSCPNLMYPWGYRALKNNYCYIATAIMHPSQNQLNRLCLTPNKGGAVVWDFEARDIRPPVPAMPRVYAPSTPMACGTTKYATRLAYEPETEHYQVENSSLELF